MMRYIYLIILGLFFSIVDMEADNSASIPLVPRPTSVVPGTGNFQFTPKTVFAVETEEQAAVIRLLSEQFACAAGFTPKLKVDSKKGDLVFQTDKNIKSEAYCLEITPKKITVKAADATQKAADSNKAEICQNNLFSLYPADPSSGRLHRFRDKL